MKCFKCNNKVEQIWMGFCGDCWDRLGDDILSDMD